MSEIDDIISGGSVGALGSNGQPQQIPSTFNAETAENDESIEMQFAVTCVEQAETYWKLITGIQPSTLKRLTKWDDEIMESFSKHFPDYLQDNAKKLERLDEDEIKSVAGKKHEYNFGTLIRLNAHDDYTETNSMFGYRVQFYAIEIARNRNGLNDKVWKDAQASKQ
ncbi:ribosome-associated Tef1p biogenesis chaperone CHP1 [Sporobolomyces koalae]|uniref:ribosome-associated Tef1p biogenesis chaperone CHP1 n=1 Tax=Sporobolomyces koalae TaxID=500713 RepID=UPI00317EFB79